MVEFITYTAGGPVVSMMVARHLITFRHLISFCQHSFNCWSVNCVVNKVM